MWPWSKTNEELETVAGGMRAEVEEIIAPGSSVIPKPITDKIPWIPITGEQQPGESAQFVPI